MILLRVDDINMTASRSIGWIWVLAAGVIAVGVGVVFYLVGLDAADKIASSAGLFVGLAGLGVSIYGIVLARRPAPPPPDDPPAVPQPPTPGSGTGSVSTPGHRSVGIGGDNSGTIVTGDNNDIQR
jgi:hypothetical protein